ncbi:facilitated trehalose transporter Tret1-like [Pieris napi]|uniref:facilitated trehalose transporter Tret1-like n=1 Tax=Pieris napi TaxID=78633 RepID=UPI001FB91824|nr:facilitated trehalose transporter Tret1-like [Pieris napi]
MAIINQVLATGVVSYLCMTMGIMYTWPSSVLGLFSSSNTTLNRVMSETELSLLGSLSSISAVVTLPFSGYILDRLGRKYTCITFSLLQVSSWAIVIAFKTVEAVLTSIFISGVTSCTFIVIPLYVGEFCQESIRGSMASGVMMFFGIGMLISYLLGGLVQYEIMNYTCLTLTVIGVLLLCYVRESPLMLMKKGFEKEAAKSLAHYRSVPVSSKEVQEEMNNIRRILNPQLDENTPEEEKMRPDLNSVQKLSIWQFFKKSRSSRRALVVSLILNSAVVFQGLVVVQVYAQPLFEQAIPSMSATVSSVIFAIVTVIAGFLAAYLVEALGRKGLMIYSSILAAICCVILGTQIQFTWGPHWVAALFIYLYCVVYTIGAGTIPYIYSAEVFLPEIKTFASMLIMEWTFMCFFVVLFIFNPLVNCIGLGGVFYIFAVVCGLTSIFCVFFMPETKGLAVDAIQLKFATPRARNKV